VKHVATLNFCKAKMKLLITSLCLILCSQVCFGSYSLLEKQWNIAVGNTVAVEGAPSCTEMPSGPLPGCPAELCLDPEELSDCEEAYTEACQEIRYWAGQAYQWCEVNGGTNEECEQVAEEYFYTNIQGPAGDYYECLNSVNCIPCP
jgi:hypothetical protein